MTDAKIVFAEFPQLKRTAKQLGYSIQRGYNSWTGQYFFVMKPAKKKVEDWECFSFENLSDVDTFLKGVSDVKGITL